MSDQPMSRTLAVMRHAKAEANAPTDHARPLTGPGVCDARAAGEWLRDQGVSEVSAIVSSAVRTQQTWREVAASVEGKARMLDGLFNAGADEVVQTVRMTDDDVRTLLVVGHNPTMQQVVWDLAEPRGSVYEQIAEGGFGTSSIAVLQFAGDWGDVAFGAGDLVAFHHR